MDEKQPTFTVTDKRKFTLEGELRDENAAAEQPEQVPPAAPAPTNVVTMPAPEEREEAKAEPADEAELPQFSPQETAEQDAAYGVVATD